MTIPKLKEVQNEWENNANCAQATAWGILNHFDYSKEAAILYNAFYGYGGGLQERMVCGAISGTLAALSIISIDLNLTEQERNNLFKKFKDKFRNKFEFLDCQSLIAPFQNNSRSCTKKQNQDKNELKKLQHEKCSLVVYFASDLAKNLINPFIQ